MTMPVMGLFAGESVIEASFRVIGSTLGDSKLVARSERGDSISLTGYVGEDSSVFIGSDVGDAIVGSVSQSSYGCGSLAVVSTFSTILSPPFL